MDNLVLCTRADITHQFLHRGKVCSFTLKAMSHDEHMRYIADIRNVAILKGLYEVEKYRYEKFKSLFIDSTGFGAQKKDGTVIEIRNGKKLLKADLAFNKVEEWFEILDANVIQNTMTELFEQSTEEYDPKKKSSN